MLDKKFSQNLHKTIKSLSVDGDTFEIMFTDGTGVSMTDRGQSCCEHRYMNCDDNLNDYVGATLYNGSIENVEEDDSGGVKECQFLKILTSKGSFTIANYNEHNGYYGGFSLDFDEITAPEPESEYADGGACQIGEFPWKSEK